MTWEIAASILGTLGGFETIKWVVNYFANRKTASRIAEAEADTSEFHILQETNLFLQQQLKEKEMRFVEQTDRLRKTQDELFQERELRYKAELELVTKRCEVKRCGSRQPQNGY